MKKILVWFLAICLVTSVAWLLARPRAGTAYPTSAVTAVLESVSAASGADMIEMRSVSGRLRAEERSVESLRLGIDRWLGRPVYDDLASYRFMQAGSPVRVTLHQSALGTGSVEIAPEPGAAAFATDLQAAFMKSFPELTCRTVAP